jgi:hypothetical protein
MVKWLKNEKLNNVGGSFHILFKYLLGWNTETYEEPLPTLAQI